jgi:hypothetical protein
VCTLRLSSCDIYRKNDIRDIRPVERGLEHTTHTPEVEVAEAGVGVGRVEAEVEAVKGMVVQGSCPEPYTLYTPEFSPYNWLNKDVGRSSTVI